jgi:tRNA(fMet)-specific endonuclease VapC
VLGEFAEGFAVATDPVVEHYRSSHRIIEVDVQVAMTYARLSRELRSRGTPIGSNDTWIAATALAHQVPLLTRNTEHFGRVGGLEVLGYK